LNTAWPEKNKRNILGNPGELVMDSSQKQLVLNKGGQHYIFRYTRGNEALLLDALIDSAEDGQTDFDWFDAAVLSYKFSQDLMGEADEMLAGYDANTALIIGNTHKRFPGIENTGRRQ
jgi:hypothetical protein